jgi:hypothetical protein
MTGNELIYQIYEDLNIHSDDTNITNEYIIQLINQQRALWVSREYNKIGTLIDSKLIQDLPITATEKVQTVLASDPSTLSFTSEGRYIRTLLQVPRAIETNRRLLYTRIGPADTTAVEIPLIPFSQINFSGNGRFNKDVIHAFHYNDYIYLTANSEAHQFVKGIAIRGIFEDPVEAASFNLPSTECWTLDSEYPLSERLFNYIKPQIIQQLVTRFQIPSDDTNDANDRPSVQPQMK